MSLFQPGSQAWQLQAVFFPLFLLKSVLIFMWILALCNYRGSEENRVGEAEKGGRGEGGVGRGELGWM